MEKASSRRVLDAFYEVAAKHLSEEIMDLTGGQMQAFDLNSVGKNRAPRVDRKILGAKQNCLS